MRYASCNGVGATSITKWQTSRFFQTATSTKWQTCCGKQTSLSHLDPINPSIWAIFEHASPIFTILYLSLSISIYLCVTSGYVWCILVVWGWHSNPMCDTRLAMALGLLALQNGKPVVFPNSHLYKMANMLWQTNISVTSRPYKSFYAIFEHASPIFTILYLSLSISIYLCVTSGYVWCILVVWGWHSNPMCDTRLAMALGLLALQNGKPVVFPNSHLYKMANMLWQTNISVTSRPYKSFYISNFWACFTHIYHSLSIFINLYLSLCYFWIPLVVWGWHLAAKWLGCCMVVAWRYKMAALQVLETSTSTKWKPRV